MKFLVLNGPNLNLLGTRQPEVYGTATLDDLVQKIQSWADALAVDVEIRQSNDENLLLEALHTTDAAGIILNPAALTHTSRALGDAIASIGIPTVEVHISNIREREPWRSTSMVSDACVRTIYGRGLTGYRDAMRHLRLRFEIEATEVRYGPDASNIGDLRGSGGRLFVLVHGGFWRHEWERDTMESLAVDLAKRGHTSWNIEYRRLGTGGGWPGSFQDVVTALDTVPQLGLSTSAIEVIGHSAGAHMAMWAVDRTRVSIDRVVSLAPITDLEELARSDRIGATEASDLLASGASAPANACATSTVVVHGSSDGHVPYRESVELTDRLGVELMTVDAGHFELLDPRQPFWGTLIDQM